jgi:hypothetical protein
MQFDRRGLKLVELRNMVKISKLKKTPGSST